MRGIYKEKLLQLLFNPFVIAFPFALITIVLIPMNTERYSFERVSYGTADKIGRNTIQYYHDLDMDGVDEIISLFENDVGQCAVKIIQNQENPIGQWNFNGRLPYGNHFISYIDYTGDNILDVFLLYERTDSVFIGGVDIKHEPKPIVTDLYIDRVERVDDKLHYGVFLKKYDLSNDGVEELIVGINAGYSELPRKLYAWDFASDTIYISPEVGFKSVCLLFDDMDGDGFVEVIPGTISYENIEEGLGVPYSDYNRWFVVFDHALNFKYGPVDMGAGQGNVKTYLSKQDAQTVLYVVDANYEIKDTYQYFIFDKETDTLKPADPFYKPAECFPFDMQDTYNYIVSYDHKSGRVIILDASHNMRLVADGMLNANMSYTGLKELPGYDFPVLSFTEHQKTFEMLYLVDLYSLNTIISYPYNEGSKIEHYSIYTNTEGQRLVVLQVDEHIESMAFTSDRFYLLRLIAVYSGIYGFYIVLFWLILRIQNQILKKYYQREQLIAELKLKTIRNQLDPHFTFNAVNAIASAIIKEDKENAYKFFSKFSSLLRSTTLYSDQMTRNLKDEIKITMQYLDIELFRYRDKFSYEIHVDDEVNVNQEVPRMIVQAFAESAVTNGLMHRKQDGKLEIEIRQKGKMLEMIFEDNGVGIEECKRLNKKKAFKSAVIMDEFIRIFNDLYHTKVSYQMRDVAAAGPFPGTRTTVSLPSNHFYNVGLGDPHNT